MDMDMDMDMDMGTDIDMVIRKTLNRICMSGCCSIL